MSVALAKNLTVQRAGMRKPATHYVNVGNGERTLSAVAGAALLLAGMVGPKRVRAFAVTSGAGLLYRGVSGNCLLYRALGVDRSAEHGEAVAVKQRRGVHFSRSILIGKSPDVIFAFWRNLPQLPNIIDHLVSVTPGSGNRSTWVARGPLDVELQWEAEIIEERPNEFLAWRSLPGFEVDTAGSIHLNDLPHDRGTEVHLVMKYDPPGGALTARLAGWLGTDVEAELFEGLRRMKQLLEAGEIPTTHRQPVGTCGSVSTRGRMS